MLVSFQTNNSTRFCLVFVIQIKQKKNHLFVMFSLLFKSFNVLFIYFFFNAKWMIVFVMFSSGCKVLIKTWWKDGVYDEYSCHSTPNRKFLVNKNLFFFISYQFNVNLEDETFFLVHEIIGITTEILLFFNEDASEKLLLVPDDCV